MKKRKDLFCYFSKGELLLWFGSVFVILLAFLLFDRRNYLILSASLIGVTSLIFSAKGNPFGQLLMIVFSLFYGVISFSFSYYGEMLTYLGMTMPMAVFAFLSWMKNPYGENKAEVAINHLAAAEWGLLALLTAVITGFFYFVLAHFNTANMLPSTISVTTSFVAVYLTFKRSPYYAIAYAANDIVLIVLWVMAALQEASYLSVVVCFSAFFINDLYGFVNWQRIGKRQAEAISS